MVELIILGVFIIISFVLGVYIGQKLSNKEKIKINPVEIIQDAKETHQLKKEITKENEKIDTELYNIENYDGTGLGQKEIPK